MNISRAIAGLLCADVDGGVGRQRRSPRRYQPWPTAKPITIVVPVPPGPAVDFVARMVAEKLRQSLGQAVVVENRGGASGSIASTMVARAAPDGYTLIAATSGTHVSLLHLMKNLPYDPIKDFTPIMAAAEPVTGLVVNAGAAGQIGAGADRLCQGQPGQADLWQLRRRIGVSCDGRIAQSERRHRDAARSLSRRGARHPGRDRRATSR